jgi:hypothetical protein
VTHAVRALPCWSMCEYPRYARTHRHDPRRMIASIPKSEARRKISQRGALIQFELEIDTDLRPLTRAPDVPFMTVHDRINRAAICGPNAFHHKTAACLYPC